MIGRGERVLRVPTKLMADARRGGSKRGKSDRIDAIAVARAGLRERLDELPLAQLDGRELDLRLLVDHRQRLVGQRVRIQNTLQWHLHDLRPELTLPAAHYFRSSGAPGSRGVCPHRADMRVRITRDELRRLRELTRAIKALEPEIAQLVAQVAPSCSPSPASGR